MKVFSPNQEIQFFISYPMQSYFLVDGIKSTDLFKEGLKLETIMQVLGYVSLS